MSQNLLKALVGDITQLKVDAIVNAANSSLLGGGGVDGAIHRAAGPELLEECRSIGGCPTGEARLTKGHRLPANYIIHTVGPIYGGSGGDEEQLLSNCYYNSLQLAHDHGLKTIAFPAISTGIFGYPKEEATAIAVKTVWKFLEQSSSSFEQIIFCCFDEQMHTIYQEALKNLDQ